MLKYLYKISQNFKEKKNTPQVEIGSSAKNLIHAILFFLANSHLTIEINTANIISLLNICCLSNENSLKSNTKVSVFISIIWGYIKYN